MPDLLGLVREPSIICSSTTPTLPFGTNTATENIPMTMLNHGLSWDLPGDVRLVLERTLEARTAAEGPLHELGAIQIVNSDSQGMGRIGETVRRTFQLAHVMKAWRRSEAADGIDGLPPDPGLDDPDDRDDTARVLRYLAKVTIEPAITHGVAAHVGSLQVGTPGGHRALVAGVLRGEARLGVQGRLPRLGPDGRGQRVARVGRADPLSRRLGRAGRRGAEGVGHLRLVRAWIGRRSPGAMGTRRSLVPVAGCRGLTRASMHANTASPQVDVDVRTGAVSLGGLALAVAPVTEVPLSRRYLLR